MDDSGCGALLKVLNAGGADFRAFRDGLKIPETGSVIPF